jgi:nucleoside-diphosphate-sugar epimerase
VTAETVLVTGAGGRLGREVVAQLAARGSRVVALVLSQDEVPVIDQYAATVHVGGAHDPQLVAKAMRGVAAVVHLAAIPAPTLGAGHVVFGQNSLATYCVLDAACEAGVARAVIASSIAATGLSFSPHHAHPAWLPIDVDLPTQAADPYALAKVTDEATAAMMSRRSGLTVTALRFPFLGMPDDRLPERATELADSPDKGVGDLWSYLDTRDAARAALLALHRTGGDSLVVGVAAPTTLAPYPTEALIDRFMPEVPRRKAFSGRECLIDLRRAETLLDFRAEHLWAVEPRNLEERS